jgi:hypothetical protein
MRLDEMEDLLEQLMNEIQEELGRSMVSQMRLR